MTAATTSQPTARHAWLDVFMADPTSGLDDFLSGHARIEPYERADAPDAARLLFGGLPEDDPVRDTLDSALAEWLNTQRLGGVPDLERMQLKRWIRKVSEAFEIIGLLKLRGCSSNLRRRFVLWNSWCDRLAISEQRDGRHAFLRTLALTQRLIAAGEAASPFALEPLWLYICEQAGGAFPKHYLAIGLLGLRMLPEREGMPSKRPWMTGLSCWATSQKPPVKEFERQWWGLKSLYPRIPSHWRKALTETLRQDSAKGIPREIKDWWLGDVQAKDPATAQESQGQSDGVPRLASYSAVQALLKRAQKPLSSIKLDIESLIGNLLRYAEATGDSYYLVTTACNIGMAIIKGTDDHIGRGQLAVQLARQALAWQPTNHYAWALWRDALAKQGAFKAAELVGWETIRRFPENVQWCNQLALLLGNLPGRIPDAELLLRESIERFPKDIVPRNQLAELLISQNRIDEATGVVDDVFSRHLENEVCFDLRARLLSHSGDSEGARDVLLSGRKRFGDDPIFLNHLRMLDDGKPLSLKSAAHRRHADAPVADSKESVGAVVWQRGRLRRIFSERRQQQGDSEWRDEAIQEVQRVLKEDPNLAYAQYLGREMEGQGGKGSADGLFAVAFTDALKRKDADQFASLENSFSGQTQFIDVAKAFLFHDRAAADRAFIWFRHEARGESRAVSALRGFLRQRVDMSSITSGEDFAKQVAANDNIEMDMIEAVLAGDEMLLAA